MNHAAINALVAERVMGWKFWLETRGEHLYVIPQRPGDREPWTRYRDGESHKERYKPITTAEFDSRNQIHLWRDNFDPSRNIAHAMEVFDKWTHASIEKSGGAYEVTINSWATEYRTDICIAICLAALRAMGVPDKEIEEVCGGE